MLVASAWNAARCELTTNAWTLPLSSVTQRRSARLHGHEWQAGVAGVGTGLLRRCRHRLHRQSWPASCRAATQLSRRHQEACAMCVGFVRLERTLRGACGDEAYCSMLVACSAVPSGSSNGLNAKHTLSVLGACCSHTALRHGLASAGG